MLPKSNELQKKIIMVSIIGGVSADSEAQRVNVSYKYSNYN